MQENDLEWQIEPSATQLSLKQRPEYQYYQVEGKGRVILREAPKVLEKFLKAIYDNCSHEHCIKPMTDEEIIRQKKEVKIVQQYIKTITNDSESRPLYKPQYICIQKQEQDSQSGLSKSYFKCLLVPSNCMKDIVCYMIADKLFTKKKDAEGYTCLRTIKFLHEKGFIDDYFFPNKDKIKEHLEQRNDLLQISVANINNKTGDQKILIKNNYIQQEFKVDVDYLMKINALIFETREDESMSHYFENKQNYIGIIASKDIQFENLSYEIQIPEILITEFFDKIQQESKAINSCSSQQQKVPEDEIDKISSTAVYDLYQQFIQETNDSSQKSNAEILEEPLTAQNIEQENKENSVKASQQKIEVQKLKFQTKNVKINYFSENLNVDQKNKINFEVFENLIEFFHTYCFYFMQNAELEFIKTLKEPSILSQQGFAFRYLFIDDDQSIRDFDLKEQFLFDQILNDSTNILQSSRENKSCLNLKHYLIPIIQISKEDNSDFQINFKLIEEVFKKVISELLGPQKEVSTSDITKGRIVIDKENLQKYIIVNADINEIEQEENKFQNTTVICKKLPGFINYLPVEKAQNARALKLDKDSECQLPVDKLQLSPFQYYDYCQLMLSCSNYTKLNDQLKLENFVNNFLSFNSTNEENNKQQQSSKSLFDKSFLANNYQEDMKTLALTNINVLKEALTAQSAETDDNYERLEFYGDSVISFLVIIELFCQNRESDFTEQTLDKKRIDRTSNSYFTELAIEKGIANYLQSEPYSNNFKHMTPPGLENFGFQMRQKKNQYQRVNERFESNKQFQQSIKQEEDNHEIRSLSNQVSEKRQKKKKPIDQQDTSLADNMLFQIKAEKKIADTFEAVVGAITQIGGLNNSYKFLKEMTVLKFDQNELVNRLEALANIMKQQQGHQDLKMEDIEDVLGYKFNNKYILQTALTHKSYADYMNKKNLDAGNLTKENTMDDYNILEFLGDSIIGLYVGEFFFKKTQKFKQRYSSKELHDLKSQITNNIFLGFITIENGIQDKILKYEKAMYNRQYDQYIYELNEFCKDINGGNTRRFYEQLKLNHLLSADINKQTDENRENWNDYKEGVFDEKQMEKYVQLQEQLINLNALNDRYLKIFGDIMESLIGAVFLDSYCTIKQKVDDHNDKFLNLQASKGKYPHIVFEVLHKLFKPYLFFYGNFHTIPPNPRTKCNEFWSQLSYTKNLKVHHITQISLTLNKFRENKQSGSETMVYFKGYISNTEILRKKYKQAEKSKIRHFYDKLLQRLLEIIYDFEKDIPPEKRDTLHLMDFIKKWKAVKKKQLVELDKAKQPNLPNNIPIELPISQQFPKQQEFHQKFSSGAGKKLFEKLKMESQAKEQQMEKQGNLDIKQTQNQQE